MRWMGLDIGSRRIGVALSDAEGIIAQPLLTLEADGDGGLPMGALRGLVDTHQVEGVVVGWPRRMDGTLGPEALEAASKAGEIEDVLNVEVVLWDERLTSVQAERLLVEAGVRRGKRRGATDRIAAALILRGYLDSRRARAVDPADPGEGGGEG